MMRASGSLFGAIGALAMLQTAAWAQTVPLVGDTFIHTGVAANYGALVNVNVGGVSGFVGLVQFDLTKLPPGTTASSVSVATLRLFVNKVGAAGAVNFYAANGSWTESGVNGNNAPGPGTAVATGVPITVADSYIAIPVTSLVQSWLTGNPNNGFIITANPGTSVFFDSKENTTTSHPAVLEIDLTVANGATGAPGPSGAAGPTGVIGPSGAVGPSGAAGPQGAAGSAGAAGATGPAGPQGPSGAQGATGAAGLAGAIGANGPSGPAGPTGAVGPAGPTGATGAVGAPGPAGATGSIGLTGPAGVTGDQGLINNGFTVTTVSGASITIADTETHNQMIVVNATGNGAALSNTVTLPNSATVGAGFMIELNVLNWGTNDGTFQVQTQGSDVIVDQDLTFNSTAPYPFNYQGELVTDGNHHWYLLINN